MPNRFDVQIDGVKYRLLRGEGSYARSVVREAVDFQEIETMPGSQFSSRNDVRKFFQTSWAGGSRWEKPLMSQEAIDTYHIAHNFDPVSEPGYLFPKGHATFNAHPDTAMHTEWVWADKNVAYAVGKNGSTYHKILKWVNGTTSVLAQNSHSPNANIVLDACWDNESETFYTLDHKGIRWTKPGTGSGDVTSSTVWSATGASIFMYRGDLHLWNGNRLYKVKDPLGTPVFETVFDDGVGWTWLQANMNNAPAALHYVRSSPRHAIPTAEGIYLVKTVRQNSSLVSNIYRIDRDASGTNIGTPVATLDAGYIVLDLYWSMGSLLISATDNRAALLRNDASQPAPEVRFFHVTGGSLGSIGTALGRKPDDMVFKFLTSYNGLTFIGGSRNVWAYDPVRGGIHMLHRGNIPDGHYSSALQWDNGISLFCNGKMSKRYTTLYDTDGLVAGHSSYLESGYFDYSLPGELKQITSASVGLVDVKAGEKWTLKVSADDGPWVTMAEFTESGHHTVNAASPVEGFRFRYRVEYGNAAGVNPASRLYHIMFGAVSGDMVSTWQLTIDGTEARNVENGIVRPVDVFNSLSVLCDKSTVVDLVDVYESDDRSDQSTYSVRVQQVTVLKEEPKESVIRVVLVEA